MLRKRAVRFASLVAGAVCAPCLAVCAEPAAERLPEIAVSRRLLEARGLEVGQVVRLATTPDAAVARPFRIVAGYEPVPNPFILTENRFEVRLHLPDLIELRNPSGDPLVAETVSRINVELADPADAAAFERELTARVPGVEVAPAQRREEGGDPFLVLERFHLAIATITVVGSSAFLLALMVIRSEERRETAGILRLIGLPRRRILLEGFFEGLVIALAGAAFGVGVALALEGAFNRFFQWYYDTALIFVAVRPATVVRCLALAVPLGVVAGLVASWMLLRREILALLRR